MDGGGEDFGVGVDVGFGGGRGHEGHVVEGREEDATVEGVEVEEALELEVGGGRRLAAVARRFRSESVFGAGAEANDVPEEAGGPNVFGSAIGETFGEGDHALERSGCEDMFECSAHGG